MRIRGGLIWVAVITAAVMFSGCGGNSASHGDERAKVTLYPLGAQDSIDLALSSDGTPWVATERGQRLSLSIIERASGHNPSPAQAERVGQTERIKRLHLPERYAATEIAQLATGPGNQIWLKRGIGTLATDPSTLLAVKPSGEIRELPVDILQGDDIVGVKGGAIWFTSGRGLGLRQTDGRVKRFALSDVPSQLSAAPDEGVNYSLTPNAGTTVGHMSPSGKIRSRTVLVKDGTPGSPIWLSNGSLWISYVSGESRDEFSSHLLQLSSDGKESKVPVPDLGPKGGFGDPFPAAPGIDGESWFYAARTTYGRGGTTRVLSGEILKRTDAGRFVSVWKSNQIVIAGNLQVDPSGDLWFAYTAADCQKACAGGVAHLEPR